MRLLRLPRARAFPPGAVRFFQIGFHRCGTTSISAFFNRSGIPSVHYDGGRLARRLRENLACGRRPLEGYDHRYRAFTNMDFIAPRDYFEGFRHYAELLSAYGGRFILNTRPLEHWLRSLMTHGGRRVRPLAQAHAGWRFGTADPERIAQHWRALWEEHHRRVRAELPPERLLVFDIESDPPERLCEFADLPLSCARFYTRENASLGRVGLAVVSCVPRPVKRAMPDRVKLPLKRLLRARG